MPARPTRATPSTGPVFEVTPARDSRIAEGFHVRRALPHRGRRLVGAWCFLDHFGPAVVGERPLDVAPHPHTGLSTVTWLLEGEVLHKDSLGSEQVIRPGQLNWMTSGWGISHSEEGLTATGERVHGVQLWVALPDPARTGEASFVHHADLPHHVHASVEITVLAGTHDGATSPARTVTPLVGLDVALSPGGRHALPLEPGFEHAVVVTEGRVRVDGRDVQPGHLVYLGMARDALPLASEGGGRCMVIGGAPFEDPVLLGWNFVVRDADELEEAFAAWRRADARFGEVTAYTKGPRIEI